jgi:phosphoserine phosphatase RsbU/P
MQPFATRENLVMVKPAIVDIPDVTLEASRQLLERNEEMEQDLMAARAVQRFLLPPENQDFTTHRVSHVYQPLHHIGGDFLDVAQGPSGQRILRLADVSGHGVPAAMSSAMLKTVFVHHAAAGGDPGQILTSIDHELQGLVRFGRFITALVAAYDPVGRTVQLASAGHPQPLLIRGDQATIVEMETELPLLTGATPQYLTAATLQLQPQDRLLLYTDGVTESTSVGRRSSSAADPCQTLGMLGVEGLIAAARRVAAQPGPAFLEALFNQLFFGDLVFGDDVTLLCLEVL